MLDHRCDVEADATVKRRAGAQMGTRLHNEWILTCSDRKGRIKWVANVPHNLVVTEGLNHSITQHFKGAAYTAAWYIGLTDASPTFAAADTMAAHGGWVEVTTYSQGHRQTLTLGSVSGGSAHNHASVGTFTSNAVATIGGLFLCTDSAIGSANGTLYGGGAFSTGNKPVGSGDLLSAQAAVYAGAA